MLSFRKGFNIFLWIIVSFEMISTQIHSFIIGESKNTQKGQLHQQQPRKISPVKLNDFSKLHYLYQKSRQEIEVVLVEHVVSSQNVEKNTKFNEKDKKFAFRNIRHLSIVDSSVTKQRTNVSNKQNSKAEIENFAPNKNSVSSEIEEFYDYNGKKISISSQPNIKGVSLSQIQTAFTTSLLPTVDFNSFLAEEFTQKASSYISGSSSSADFPDFPEVTLSHSVPDVFLEGELFLFTGKVNFKEFQNLSDSKVITVAFTDEYLSYKRVYTQKLQNGEIDFQILTQIPQQGKYKIAIFYGLKGVPAQKIYTVVQKDIESQTYATKSNQTNKSSGAQFQVVENNLYLKINSNIHKKDTPSFLVFFLRFNQEFDDEVTLIYSNLAQSQYIIKIPYYKFANFYEVLTQVQIYVGQSKTLSAINLTESFRLIGNQSFFATYHQFNERKKQILQLSSQPPFHINQRGTAFSIIGVAKQQLRNQIVVLEPSKIFKQYSINASLKQSDKILTNSSLNISFLFDKEGTYIIEINHADGYAVLNQPVYVGFKIYPLLPDFEDLKPYKTDRGGLVNKSIDAIKQTILASINQKRREFDQNPLKLDMKLNIVAQKHADDMMAKNYISHYSPEGLGPVDRAKKGGITQEVSENIALNSDIQDAHYRLCRSNIHLRNMVRPYWQRLGLGITINSQGAYIIVQEYSTRDLKLEPFTTKQIAALKNDIMNALISVSTIIKSINETLSADVSQYAKIKSQNNSTQFANLGDYLKSTKKYSKWSYTNIKVTYKSEGIVEVIKNQTTILPKNSKYTQIGMSLEYSSGFLVLYFAFV